MFSHAVIDASQEAQLRGLDKARYDSNLLNAKRLTVSANGQTTEAIKILDTPILYDYAERRNQIGRFDVKLLDSPVNKTEENIVLDGYLRRRIDASKDKDITVDFVNSTRPGIRILKLDGHRDHSVVSRSAPKEEAESP